MRLQVVGGFHAHLEVGIVVRAAHLYLRGVERKIAEIAGFCSVGAEHDALGRQVVADHDAKAVAEEGGGIEGAVDLEFLLRQFHLLDAVEGENAIVAVGIPRENVPAAVEELDAIGGDDVGLRFGRLIAPVVHGQHLVGFHGMDDDAEEVAVRRDVLQQDAVLQRQAFGYQVVHAQRGQHPVLHAFLSQDMLVADEILVAVLAVAVDEDAEDVLNGILVAVEGGAGEGHAAAHVGGHPLFVDFGETDSSGAADDIDQPDVFFEQCRYLHGSGGLTRCGDFVWSGLLPTFLFPAAGWDRGQRYGNKLNNRGTNRPDCVFSSACAQQKRPATSERRRDASNEKNPCKQGACTDFSMNVCFV